MARPGFGRQQASQDLSQLIGGDSEQRQRPSLGRQQASQDLDTMMGRQRPGLSKQQGIVDFSTGDAGKALLKDAIVDGPSGAHVSGGAGRDLLRRAIT